MRAVRLTRANGVHEHWRGDAGDIRILEDDDAARIVDCRLAVYAPEHDPVTFVGPEAAAARLESLTAVLPEPDFGQDPRYIQEDIERSREMKRPYGNASKAAWIDWAVHNGADPGEVAGWTKTQLMSSYGERL